jgi:hypothetical protein
MTEFIRGAHKGDYTQLSNKTLRDISLSWKARGLLVYLLSHSEGYHIRADNLHQFSSDGPFTTASAIKELKQAGYICFYKHQNAQTKAWEAGHWVISEEAELPKSLTSGKPNLGKPGGRESLSQENHGVYKKDQEERISNKKEDLKEKRIILRKTIDSFDPEDLPSHLGNNQPVNEAWLRFVQSRREKKQRITQVAYKMLIKKMLAHSPEEVVTALDISSERGYAGVFYHDDGKQSIKGTMPISSSQPSTPLDLDGRRLRDWLVETLADPCSSSIPPLLAQMRQYHKNIPTDPNHPDQHRATSQLGWESFFNRWMEYLQHKQMTGFTLQSFQQLKIGGARWNEFIQGCEKYTSYSFRTGRYLG